MLDPALRSIRRSTGQARAKIVLFGEHAVVHGTRAIAAGIRGGAEALAIADGRAELHLGGRLARRTDGSAEATAFEELNRALGASAHAAAHSAQVTLHVPAGVGLGASAATAVAVARALARLLDPPPSEAQILEAALAWERVFHGNPSGVDTAAAASGGCISFRRGEPPRQIRVREPVELVVGVTGMQAAGQSKPSALPTKEPRTRAPKTKEMVELVAQFGLAQPLRFQQILAQIEQLAAAAEHAIENAELEQLGQLMNANHVLLQELGVSTSSLDELCALARQRGAWGAKLTGAGGGGAVIALVSPSSRDPVLDAWTELGVSGFATTIEPS